MKKIMIFALMVLAFSFSVNAQIVVANNYDSPISGATDVEEDDDVEFAIAGISYYSFDGFDNWGIGSTRINPNGLGMDFGLRASFEEHGNFSWDLGLNYSFKLVTNGSTKAFLTLAAGPSFRMQDQIDLETGEWDSGKFLFDAFANARLAVCFDKIYASVGYFLWAPKFKFDGDYRADGFNITIGYAF